MVAIKRAPKKETSVPIITVPLAKVKLNAPEFHPEPREVETKDGSRTFTVDPGLNAQVEIVDDHADGTYDGVKFYQNFKMKWNDEDECWELRDGTSLGALAKARYGNDFFDSDEDVDFRVEDLDEFTFMCKIVPKTNPSTKQQVGSMCHHETIMAVPSRKMKPSKAAKRAEVQNNEEFDQLSFDGISAEDEALMNKVLGKAELKEEPV